MTDIKDLSCVEFTHALGSATPAPGGGGAAALMGALGVALGDMVACFTMGKKKYADVDEDMRQLKEECVRLEDRLLSLIDGDAEAFTPLSKAYGMPNDTEEKKAEKARVMEKCLRDAAEVPLEVMRLAGRGVELLRIFADKGSVLMISDAGCGAACCRAALECGALNVHINTRSMKDRAYADRINEEANALAEKYLPMAKDIYRDVFYKCR